MVATDSTTPDARRFSVRLPIWICVLTTVVMVHTCLQIEWWNYRAGGVLPRDTRGPGNPKWRVAAKHSIRAHFQKRINVQDYDRIVAEHGHVTAEDEAALETKSRPLTPSEREELELDLEQYRNDSVLRGWVQTWGLAQYALAPLAFVLSLALLIGATARRARIGLAVLTLLSCGAIGLMLYRAYFTSLGW